MEQLIGRNSTPKSQVWGAKGTGWLTFSRYKTHIRVEFLFGLMKHGPGKEPNTSRVKGNKDGDGMTVPKSKLEQPELWMILGHLGHPFQ